MFYYGFLFQYLHNMIEGRNPLTAYLQACERSFAAQSLTPPVSIKQLRHAWNAFARLLKIDMKSSFQCPICGDSPQVVICDGTMLGFRKDLLESFSISGQCCHVPFSIGLLIEVTFSSYLQVKLYNTLPYVGASMLIECS